MKQVVVGLDIGGTNTAIGIVDREGNVLYEKKPQLPTPQKKENPDSQVDISDELCDKFIALITSEIRLAVATVRQTIPDLEVMGVGIGAPYANYYDGTIGMRNFIMITLGTGLGSGIIVNGDLVYGHDGLAGELGHVTAVPDGRQCGCGSKGHLETYCSATGIRRTVFELLAKQNNSESPLAKVPFNDLTSRMVYEAAVQNDPLALEVFAYTGEILGRSLADAVHYLSPEAIFLFGGPVAAGEILFKPTRESLERYLLPFYRNRVKLLPSKLKSGSAAIVGASALVWKELD